MNVNIQIRGGRAWSGRMDAVPRIGERVAVDGCYLRVLDVQWDVFGVAANQFVAGSVILLCDDDVLPFPKNLKQT